MHWENYIYILYAYECVCVTRSIAVAWNPGRDITKVCLSPGVQLLGRVVIPPFIF